MVRCGRRSVLYVCYGNSPTILRTAESAGFPDAHPTRHCGLRVLWNTFKRHFCQQKNEGPSGPASSLVLFPYSVPIGPGSWSRWIVRVWDPLYTQNPIAHLIFKCTTKLMLCDYILWQGFFDSAGKIYGEYSDWKNVPTKQYSDQVNSDRSSTFSDVAEMLLAHGSIKF
jgi:hypothetical protein